MRSRCVVQLPSLLAFNEQHSHAGYNPDLLMHWYLRGTGLSIALVAAALCLSCSCTSSLLETCSLCAQIDEKAVQTPFDGSGHVRISFPAKSCPSRVVFVLKETEPEAWLNSGAGDFVAQLKPPDLTNLVDKVIEAESTYTHWSLFNRFCMANDILDAADAAGETHQCLNFCSSAHHGSLPVTMLEQCLFFLCPVPLLCDALAVLQP